MTTMRSNRSDFLLKRIILGIPKVLNNKLLGLLLLCNLIMASGCSIDSTPSTNAPTDLHASTPASNSDAWHKVAPGGGGSRPRGPQVSAK